MTRLLPIFLLQAARLAFTCALLSSGLQGAEFQKLSLGFDGIGKVGKWLPITAEVNGLTAGETVELRAIFADPRGDSCVETVASGVAGADGTISLSGYFRPGRQEGTASIQVWGAESTKPLCRQNVAHGAKAVVLEEPSDVQTQLKLHVLDVPFLLTFGKVTGIEELLRNADNFSDNIALVQGVRLNRLSDLPADPLALDAIDLMLVTDSFEATQEQVQALRHWVMKGGSLFVSSGGTVPQFLDTPMGSWLRERFDIQPEPVRVRDLSPMQGFVARSTAVRTNRDSVPMALLNSDQTIRDVSSLDGTILGTQSIGAGIVRFVAVDLNRPPISGWNSLPEFYEVLMFGHAFSDQASKESRSSRISQSGISDLGTQLLATVNAIPQTGRWSTWSVMAMIVGYLFLIGPLDYLLVTKLFKRPEMTWLTFPILVAGGATALIIAVGTDGQEQLNQLHIVDITVDGQHQHTNVQSLMSVSCPDTMRSTISARPALLAAEAAPTTAGTRLGWSGRPEDVYGGMYRVGGIGLGRHSYQHLSAQADQLSDVPLLANGSRELLVAWEQPRETSQVTSSLSVSGYGLLSGSFSHQLPFTITNWALMHGNRVYRARSGTEESSLEPGKDWSSRDTDTFASDLKSFLNASRVVQATANKTGTRGATQVITPYDRESIDPMYILTTSSYFNTAGGADYVGLTNSLLGRVELSDTIKLNHAVLIGMADVQPTELSFDGEPLTPSRSLTLVRLLIPVDRRPAGTLAPTKEELEKKQKEQQAVGTETAIDTEKSSGTE